MPLEFEWFRRSLAEHVSKDVTRFVLMSVHYDADGWFVATDGHRMLAVRPQLLKLAGADKPEAGAGYHAGALRRGELYKRVQGVQFPEWRKVLPPTTGTPSVFRMSIPTWLAVRPKHPSVRACHIAAGADPGLRLGADTGGAIMSLDLRYLRPYARAGAVYMSVHAREAPVVISETKAGALKPLEAEWFGMIMPLRDTRWDSPVLTAVSV